MSIKVASLLRPAPFGLEARFSEQVDGRTWWHHVGVAAFTDEGEPAIIGGKGPGRGNYRLVLASGYRNYGGLVNAGAGLADDDFADPVLGTMGRQPPRHLVDKDGLLVIRFNPRQLAEWVDDVINDALKLGGSMDDRAREYAQKMAPFTTLTDEEMAALDAVGGEQRCRLRLPRAGSGSGRLGASDSDVPVATRDIQRPKNQEQGCPSVGAVREEHDAADGQDTATGNTRDPRGEEVAVLPWHDQAPHAGARGRPAPTFRSGVVIGCVHRDASCDLAAPVFRPSATRWHAPPGPRQGSADPSC
jgi:hypothetical protein